MVIGHKSGGGRTQGRITLTWTLKCPPRPAPVIRHDFKRAPIVDHNETAVYSHGVIIARYRAELMQIMLLFFLRFITQSPKIWSN